MLFENLHEIVLGSLAGFYALVSLALIAGLRRLRPAAYEGKPFVSIIVAARNEEHHIEGLLNCLLHQDYPNYEIIVVNDRSTDGTSAIVGRFQQGQPRVHRIDVTSPRHDMPSKKHALAQGIAGSKGEILLFTDADCQPPTTWISSILGGFVYDVGLVAGYSPYSLRAKESPARPSRLTSLLQYFIRYEEFKGAVWSAGAIGWNLGWLCTGRSLAYRRKVYDEVQGFENIKHSVSGDDDLFLQMVRRHTKWKIRYITSPASFVPTYPSTTVQEFVKQRTRHFSAGKYFSFPMKLFFFVFHATNLILLLSVVAAIFQWPVALPWWPYAMKCLFDALLFFAVAPVFNEMRFGPSFLLMEVLLVVYNTVVGPMGFIRRVDWKQEPQS